jgi:hypothetical protein
LGKMAEVSMGLKETRSRSATVSKPDTDKTCSSVDLLARVSVIEVQVRAVEKLMDERDRLYLEKFRASEVAVDRAITASDKQTATSFLASEKAIMKAEEAQREYNIRSNEFRGQLDDQAKTLMPRLETQTLFKAYEDKLEDMKRQLSELREYKSEGGGKEKAHLIDVQQRNWGLGIMVSILLGLGSLIVAVMRYAGK